MTEQLKGFRGTPGGYTYSAQGGPADNCYMAQVWRTDGKSLAWLSPLKTAPSDKLRDIYDFIQKAREGLQKIDDLCPNPTVDDHFTNIEVVIDLAEQLQQDNAELIKFRDDCKTGLAEMHRSLLEVRAENARLVKERDEALQKLALYDRIPKIEPGVEG